VYVSVCVRAGVCGEVLCVGVCVGVCGCVGEFVWMCVWV
jgi:hypothetical protein